MARDISHRTPADYDFPVHNGERRLIRRALARYMQDHGPAAGKPLTAELLAEALASWFGEDIAPSQTPIKHFVAGTAATAARTVRLLKQYLIDIKVAKPEDFDINRETSPLLHQYEAFLKQPSKGIYGERFTALIDLFSFGDVRPPLILRWRFEQVPSGLYKIVEIDPGSMEPPDNPRRGYALCGDRGHLIGTFEDPVQSRTYRFILEPQFSHIVTEGDYIYTMTGVLTKMVDEGTLTISRHEIRAGLKTGASL